MRWVQHLKSNKGLLLTDLVHGDHREESTRYLHPVHRAAPTKVIVRFIAHTVKVERLRFNSLFRIRGSSPITLLKHFPVLNFQNPNQKLNSTQRENGGKEKRRKI